MTELLGDWNFQPHTSIFILSKFKNSRSAESSIYKQEILEGSWRPPLECYTSMLEGMIVPMSVLVYSHKFE